MPRTVKEVKDRCVVDSETGCWIWKGAFGNGVPYVYAPTLDGRMATMCGRKAVKQLELGRPLQAGYRAYGTCGNDACLNPGHIDEITPAEWGQRTIETGAWRGSIKRIKASRANGRKMSAVSEDEYRQILVADGTMREIAERFGKSIYVVEKVRSGKHCSFKPIGGVFSGLI